MTTTAAPLLIDLRTDGTALARARRRVYDAETALHAARQTGVDAWVSAAYETLHRALVSYEALLDAELARSDR